MYELMCDDSLYEQLYAWQAYGTSGKIKQTLNQTNDEWAKNARGFHQAHTNTNWTCDKSDVISNYPSKVKRVHLSDETPLNHLRTQEIHRRTRSQRFESFDVHMISRNGIRNVTPSTTRLSYANEIHEMNMYADKLSYAENFTSFLVLLSTE